MKRRRGTRQVRRQPVPGRRRREQRPRTRTGEHQRRVELRGIERKSRNHHNPNTSGRISGSNDHIANARVRRIDACLPSPVNRMPVARRKQWFHQINPPTGQLRVGRGHPPPSTGQLSGQVGRGRVKAAVKNLDKLRGFVGPQGLRGCRTIFVAVRWPFEASRKSLEEVGEETRKPVAGDKHA